MTRYPDRDYLYAAAEFGTCKAISVVAALRAENQAHHYCGPDDPATARAKRRLVEVFCPQSEHWRRRVLERSRQLVAQAIGGLASQP